jgi:hypothetical protein
MRATRVSGVVPGVGRCVVAPRRGPDAGGGSRDSQHRRSRDEERPSPVAPSAAVGRFRRGGREKSQILPGRAYPVPVPEPLAHLQGPFKVVASVVGATETQSAGPLLVQRPGDSWVVAQCDRRGQRSVEG